MASISKRGSSYRIMASAGRKVTGKQVRPSITWTPEPGMTPKQIEKELERIRIDFERRVETGQFISARIPFKEYADLWMARGKEGGERPLAPKTYERYTSLLERINQAIGHLMLQDLRQHHIRAFIGNLRESGIKDKVTYIPSPALLEKVTTDGRTIRKFAIAAGVSADTVSRACRGQNIAKDPAGKISKALGVKTKDLFTADGESGKLSDRTVLHYYRLISAILTAAVVDDAVLQENPAKKVRPPRCERTEADYMDEKQAAHLLELLDAEPMEYQAAVQLLLFTGMRRGEAMGLKWSDVDFENSTLSIRRSSQYLPGKGVFQKDPKNQASVRTIKLPGAAVTMLKEYKVWQNEERLKLGDFWQPGDWVFTAWNGTPMNPDTLSGWFRSFIRKTDLHGVHIHTLRHTNATLLIAAGENIRTVSRRLGHSQTSTTSNIYSHAIESADARAAETLENILAPVKSTK